MTGAMMWSRARPSWKAVIAVSVVVGSTCDGCVVLFPSLDAGVDFLLGVVVFVVLVGLVALLVLLGGRAATGKSPGRGEGSSDDDSGAGHDFFGNRL